MKYFLDSAKLDEIKYAYENYGIDGVTTNPKHIKLSGKPFMTCVKEIAQWLKDAGLEERISRYPSRSIHILTRQMTLWQQQKKLLPTAQTTALRFHAAKRV